MCKVVCTCPWNNSYYINYIWCITFSVFVSATPKQIRYPPACCCLIATLVYCVVWCLGFGPASAPLHDWRPVFKHLFTCFPFDQCLPFLLIFQITDACQRINYLDRCSVDSSTSCGVRQRDLSILPAFQANHPQSISKSTWLPTTRKIMWN